MKTDLDREAMLELLRAYVNKAIFREDERECLMKAKVIIDKLLELN